jgi:hypothetical protein
MIENKGWWQSVRAGGGPPPAAPARCSSLGTDGAQVQGSLCGSYVRADCAEALGGAAEGSYGQEAAAAAVEEDGEMEREDTRGVAKRPDLNELDVCARVGFDCERGDSRSGRTAHATACATKREVYRACLLACF